MLTNNNFKIFISAATQNISLCQRENNCNKKFARCATLMFINYDVEKQKEI